MDESIQRVNLGAAIREKRTALGFSQESFADAIKMHRAYYATIERGERNVTLQTLNRVAAGLKLRTSELLRIAGN